MDEFDTSAILEAGTEARPGTELESLRTQLATLEIAYAEAQQAHGTAQLRVRTLIEHAPQAIVLFDVESNRFIDANPMAEKLFGLPREELLKVGPFALSAPHQANGRLAVDGDAMIAEALGGGAPIFEWWHCNIRGERFPCEVRLVKIPWGDRDVIHGTIVDISSRKLLELSERGRRQILEGIAHGVSLHDSLDVLVRTIEELFPGMTCSVLLLNQQTNCLQLGAAPNLPDFYNAAVEGLAIGPTVGSCGAAAFTGRRVIASDVATHPNWAGFQQVMQRTNLKACWSEPVISLAGKVLGTFAMYYGEPREPAPVELRAIELAAMLAGLAIEHERRLKLERSHRERAEVIVRSRERDFDVARRIQEQMLPKQRPQIPGFEIAGRCRPAKETGGDFFDYHALPGGKLGLVVADVSSHGFSSALIMIETRRLLRMLARANCDLAEILTVANAAVYEDTDDTMFVTAFLAQLDPATRALCYIGAGHEAYVLDTGGNVERLESTGLPLGVIEDLEFPAAESRMLRPGDLLLLLSDGFHEAQSPRGELFGIDRVWDTIRANASRPAAGILDAVFHAAEDFCQPDRPGDDMTAVIVKVQEDG